MAHRFTIGVEEEFQIIDPATCELRSHVSQIVSAASPSIAEQVKHELHQSIVETGTRICENVSELRIEMHRTRGELVAAAELFVTADVNTAAIISIRTYVRSGVTNANV